MDGPMFEKVTLRLDFVHGVAIVIAANDGVAYPSPKGLKVTVPVFGHGPDIDNLDLLAPRGGIHGIDQVFAGEIIAAVSSLFVVVASRRNEGRAMQKGNRLRPANGRSLRNGLGHL